MKTATLYEIREDLAALDDLLAEVGGDVSEADVEAAVDAWLAESGEAMRSKIDSYAALIRTVEARGAARKAEADRLRALATTDENTVKRLKGRLLWFFQDREIPTLDTDRFRISVSQNGGATPVVLRVAPEDLPEDWRTSVVTYRAETDRIRAALERGEALPFAALGERGSHIRIR